MLLHQRIELCGYSGRALRAALAVFLLLGFAAPILAQAPAAEVDMVLLADPRPDEIALRWAPADYTTLAAAFTAGYRLERQTVSGVGPGATVLATDLLEGEILPYPIPAWKTITDTSDFARSIGSVVHPDGPPADANEAAFRHGIALFSADLDFAAAQAAGLGYVDRTVKPGTFYRYVISTGDKRAAQTLNSDYRNEPMAVQGATGTFTRHYVDLSWNRALTDRTYTSYDVQRSADGGQTFVTLNEQPLIQILNDENYDTLQYFRDTLPDFETEFTYRIIGTTPFSRQGPPSVPVIGRALPDARDLMPRITEMTLDVEENYRISWDVPSGRRRRVVAYEVLRSPLGYEGYVSRSGQLDATEKFWIERAPQDGYFYRVHAYDEDGFTYVSNPRLMLVDDTEPPTPPPGIVGAMDSTGIVTLTWQPSVEDDVKGYRVLFSNRPKGYFAQITSKETTNLTYRDSVTMDTRAEDVYYKLIAVDYSGNYSKHSEPVRVSRPDTKPPTAPVFREVGGNENAVTLEVALSSSDDVVYHLWEREDEDGAWSVLDTIRSGGAIVSLTDESAEPGTPYRYRVVAVDDADLQSFTEVITAERIDTGLRGTIGQFNVRILTTRPIPAVSWSYPPAADLEGFQLYRAEGDGQLLGYRLIDATSPDLRLSNGTFTYLDRAVTPGQTYTYRLMARHQDGGFSPLTETLTVQLPD